MNARVLSLLLMVGTGRCAEPGRGIPTISLAGIVAMARENEPLPRAPVPDLPATDPGEPVVVVVPDADGVLDETGALQVRDTDGIPNPFVLRSRPAAQTREERLTVESILVGARPDRNAAVVNGRVCSPGEILDGLLVAAISQDAIDLRHNRLLLHVPVQEGPVTLRLSR